MTVPLCRDRKSTRLNSSHTVIYTLSLHDALPIYYLACCLVIVEVADFPVFVKFQFIKGVAQDDSAALSCRCCSSWRHVGPVMDSGRQQSAAGGEPLSIEQSQGLTVPIMG